MIQAEVRVDHVPSNVREVNQWLKRFGADRKWKVQTVSDSRWGSAKAIMELGRDKKLHKVFSSPSLEEIRGELQRYVPVDWPM